MTADDLADIRPKLEGAKKKPVNFGACVGNDAQSTVILFSKTKEGKALAPLAKKAGGTNKTTYGTVAVVDGVVILSCADGVPSGICKKLKGLFASQKISLKVQAVGPDGKPADTDSDDAVKPGLGDSPTETQTETSDTAAEKPAAAWDKIVAMFGPRVIAYVKSGAEKAQQVGTAWKAALAAAEAGRTDDAMTIVNKLLPVLRQVGKAEAPPEVVPELKPTQPVEPTPGSKPTAKEPKPDQKQPEPKPEKSEDERATEDFGKAARLWRESVKAMGAEMGKLEAAIKAHLAPDAALAEIADDTDLLAVRLEVFDLDLADTLEEAAKAPPEKRADLKGESQIHLQRYLDALDGSFFKVVDDANGFAKVAVAATARRSLAAIDKILA